VVVGASRDGGSLYGFWAGVVRGAFIHGGQWCNI